MGLPMDAFQNVLGSFRDPASRVFLYEDRVYRGLDEASHEVLRELTERGLLARLMAEGVLVDTEPVPGGPLQDTLADAQPPFRHFLRHQSIPALSWPFEWTVSMLADAGLLTLDLQLRLLEAGCSLKDASAYNVQFAGGRPTFIDLGSIERPGRLDVWIALGQFSQMFTFPLLLCRSAGWDLRSYFLGSLGGRDAGQVAAAFGRCGWLRPGLLWDVTLPALLTRWAARRKGLAPQVPVPLPGQKGTGTSRCSEPVPICPTSSMAQVLNLKRLRRKIARLAAGYRPRGAWSRYAQTCDYPQAAHEAKFARVERFLRETHPLRVLDLGCNTGEYSRLAARCGAQVVAVDADHDAVELLYRRLRAEPAAITPAVVDLCQPSPGMGFMNSERSPWLDRAAADCVLALALMHHLVLSGNLSLAALRDLLFTLSRRHVVLEFVPTDDAMFRRLVEFRADGFDDLTLERCREVFCRRFHLLAEEPLPGTKRTLLFFQK